MKYVTVAAVAAFASIVMLQPVAQAATQSASQASAHFEQPSKLVRSVADEILKALDGHRQALRQHPAQVRAIIEKYLLPHFDTQLAAAGVLGRFAKTATKEQKARFVQAFKDSLIKNYGAFIVDFHSNMLTVYPTHVKPGTVAATVRTYFTRSDGSKVPVFFDVYMTKNDGWKVFDLKVDGVSYVMSYRADLRPQLEQYGLNTVIKRLEQGETPSAIKKH